MPHSEIHGSKGARPSPRLIAACHVFHRLLPPRHPSNALESLDRSSLMFMHGEDCAAIRRSRHTRPRPAHKRARQCLSPSCVSNDGAYAHGRTLNSRCHRTAGAHEARRRIGFSYLRAKSWWSRTGSNRRPEACKATALPTELRPRTREAVVGPDRFELSTPRLSSVCSNQLSYGPSPAAAVRDLRVRRNWARKSSSAGLEGEKRNGDGGGPLNALTRETRGACSRRSRGSACADIQSKSSLERR